MINIGLKIKENRIVKNLSANKLAQILEVDSSTISKIENGKAFPSIQLLNKFCNYMGITLSDFFAEDAPDISPELRRLLDEAKNLTPTQIQKLTEFIQTMKGE
jgi:HTH-type transcriptional repressor of puuD